MECLRCHGMMVEERFEDLRGDPHDISFQGWRCVCCGDVMDPVIARHRTAGFSPVRPIRLAQPRSHQALHYGFPGGGIESPAA